MTRARSRVVDLWDDDDEAIQRMREALAPKPPPEPAQPPPPPVEDPAPTREELQQLRNLAAIGAPDAIARLRRALGRLRG